MGTYREEEAVKAELTILEIQEKEQREKNGAELKSTMWRRDSGSPSP